MCNFFLSRSENPRNRTLFLIHLGRLRTLPPAVRSTRQMCAATGHPSLLVSALSVIQASCFPTAHRHLQCSAHGQPPVELCSNGLGVSAVLAVARWRAGLCCGKRLALSARTTRDRISGALCPGSEPSESPCHSSGNTLYTACLKT